MSSCSRLHEDSLPNARIKLYGDVAWIAGQPRGCTRQVQPQGFVKSMEPRQLNCSQTLPTQKMYPGCFLKRPQGCANNIPVCGIAERGQLWQCRSHQAPQIGHQGVQELSCAGVQKVKFEHTKTINENDIGLATGKRPP